MSAQNDCVVISITADAMRPDCARVRIEDDVYVVDSILIVQMQLREGLTLTAPQVDALRTEAMMFAAKQRALSLLGQRAYTAKELAVRLERHAYDQQCIERVVTWMAELGYINDQAYAMQWVNQRSQRKGLGPLRLRHELTQKGVDPEIVQELLATLSEDELEALAYDQAHRRLLRAGETPPERMRTRIYGFLQRRGFPAGIIHRVLRRVFDEFPA